MHPGGLDSSMSDINALRRIARQAMLDRGFAPDFSPAALQQSASAETTARAAEPAIRDLRALQWISIDNADSRDLDQVAVAEALADGATKLMVGIADVDVLVERDSPIDDHARNNTTSIYTAAQIFSMLPE